MKVINLFLVSLFLFSSCDRKEKRTAFDFTSNVDTSVNPADDFFAYANGFWIKNNPIPGDESGWGIGNLVNEELYNRKLAINEEAIAKKSPSAEDKMIANFWKTAMDTNTIEKMGNKPLKPELDRIFAIQTKEDLIAMIGSMHTYGVGVFFSEGVGQDQMNSEEMAYYIFQGGLGLPNRDYYFNTDERTAKIRAAYPAYIRKQLMNAGFSEEDAAIKAQNILDIETMLANNSRKLEALRDPYANYNKRSLESLYKAYPHTNWASILKTIGVHSIDSVIVGQPEFLAALDQIIGTTNLIYLKDYLSFHLINDFAPYLSSNFAQAKFDFYGKKMRGTTEEKPRWKRVLDAEEDAMGELLGKLFAKEYFNEQAKKRYEDIVENVRAAYKNRIDKLDWMTPETRKRALEKLSTISKKVGYPDKWKDFSKMEIGTESYVKNIMNAHKWYNEYSLNKLGKPVDRTEWDMTPQTYNAYYNPSNNEIVLPAGIFTVPGYRDEELDDAVVYGYAAASTVGHEITHGFDDEGRQYDDKGNLRNWWTEDDERQFTRRAEYLVNQFNGYMPVDTFHINGKATLGENLADLGGILIGLDAFKKTEAYTSGKKIGGYTPLQRYFLGYALGWMYAIRDESLANRILTDVHSPAKYRVNGPLRNVPEFYEAFDVQPGNNMYLADSLRVKLW